MTGGSDMSALCIEELRRDLSLAPNETIFDKPTIDESGAWVRRLFARHQDAQGRWHDRPLLTAFDLITTEQQKDTR